MGKAQFRLGWMWFDNDGRTTLQDKVGVAAARYHGKFGYAPDLCCIHPELMPGGAEEVWVGPVRVVGLGSVLRHHFWLGISEDGWKKLQARESKAAGRVRQDAA